MPTLKHTETYSGKMLNMLKLWTFKGDVWKGEKSTVLCLKGFYIWAIWGFRSLRSENMTVGERLRPAEYWNITSSDQSSFLIFIFTKLKTLLQFFKCKVIIPAQGLYCIHVLSGLNHITFYFDLRKLQLWREDKNKKDDFFSKWA